MNNINKKDIYDMIAMLLRNARIDGEYMSGELAVKGLSGKVADYFEMIDETFNKERFYKISNPNINIPKTRERHLKTKI